MHNSYQVQAKETYAMIQEVLVAPRINGTRDPFIQSRASTSDEIIILHLSTAQLGQFRPLTPIQVHVRQYSLCSYSESDAR